MTLALHNADIVSNIVAVDNGPIALPIPNDFKKYMEGLAEVEQAQVPTHAEGERILAKLKRQVKSFSFFPSSFSQPMMHVGIWLII